MMTPDRETLSWSCFSRRVSFAHTGLLRLPDFMGRKEIALQNYLYIAAGGALRSLERYWVGAAVANRMGTRFPYGTFIVNMSACLLLGFVLTLLGRRPEFNPEWRFLIPIGFVGAYSTFSTFEWEAFANLQTGAFLIAGLYMALSCVLGLAAVWCGVLLARLCV